MLVALTAVGAIALLYFLLYGRYFDIHTTIISSEAQRHAINIVQVIISSDKLVYEEDFGTSSSPIIRYHRGILDSEKLDEQMVKVEDYDGFSTTKESSSISDEIGYPNTIISIIVYDIDTGNRWALSYSGPKVESGNDFWSCMHNNIDKSFFGLPQPGNLAILWNSWDVKECWDTYSSKLGVFEKDFPVSIMDGDGLHSGRILVRVMEMSESII
jgi:hypothetical protein